MTSEHAKFYEKNSQRVLNKDGSLRGKIMRNDTYWLIERGQPENHAPTIWLKSITARREHACYEDTWTDISTDAERYCSKKAAQPIVDEIGNCRATEHGDISSLPAPGGDELEARLRAWAHNERNRINGNIYAADLWDEAATALAALRRENGELKRLAAIGEAWEKDSSLEKWFPITAEQFISINRQLSTVAENCNRLNDEKNAAEAALSAARDEGLEEAKKVCFQAIKLNKHPMWIEAYDYLIKAIRNLRSKARP